MILTGLFLILGVKEYLFRLYALLPAGLPAGRWRSHSSVWQAQRGRVSVGVVAGRRQARRLGLTKPAKSSRLAHCMACAAARSVCNLA